MLVRGRSGDMLPAKHDEATAVARLLGYKPVVSSNGPGGWSDTLDPAQALEQDYRRTARHARSVMDRLFYG
jgi:glutamate-ammonia-ligase adenylyltransferase